MDTKVPTPLVACPLCAGVFEIAAKNNRGKLVENDRFCAHPRKRRTLVVERDEDRNGVGDGTFLLTFLLQRLPGKHTVVPGKVTMIVLLAGSRHRQQESHRAELMLRAENVQIFCENLLHAAHHALHPRRLLSGRTFLDRQKLDRATVGRRRTSRVATTRDGEEPFAEEAVHGLEQIAKDFDPRKVLLEHDVAYDRRAHRVDTFARCQVQRPGNANTFASTFGSEYIYRCGEARETSGHLLIPLGFALGCNPLAVSSKLGLALRRRSELLLSAPWPLGDPVIRSGRHGRYGKATPCSEGTVL